MTAVALPGGRLPLVLAWLGGTALFAAALLAVLHGADIDSRFLAITGGWGTVALALGINLRSSAGSKRRLFGFFWLLPAVGAFIWLMWVRYG